MLRRSQMDLMLSRRRRVAGGRGRGGCVLIVNVLILPFVAVYHPMGANLRQLIVHRHIIIIGSLSMYLGLTRRSSVTFHTFSPVRSASRAMARRRGTTRPKAMARLQQLFIRCHAVRQMNQQCQDTCLLPFARISTLSYWPCWRLNVAWQQQPPPPPRWARAAHPGPQVASTGFSFSLSALC